jgi:prepilin-type N-terminal cleavage/methylation domain-containing protein
LKRGEQGLTLIEVLVTLVILSMVSVIIWSVFFQGYKFSQESISKNFMIQETNVITTNLKRIHQTSAVYEIFGSGSSCEIKVVSQKKDPSSPDDLLPQVTQEFEHSKLCFKIIDSEIKEIDSNSGDKIEPDFDEVELTISTSERNNTNNSVTIETYLYKVKGADYNE